MLSMQQYTDFAPLALTHFHYGSETQASLSQPHSPTPSELRIGSHPNCATATLIPAMQTTPPRTTIAVPTSTFPPPTKSHPPTTLPIPLRLLLYNRPLPIQHPHRLLQHRPRKTTHNDLPTNPHRKLLQLLQLPTKPLALLRPPLCNRSLLIQQPLRL
jgi:hypothetical protein